MIYKTIYERLVKVLGEPETWPKPGEAITLTAGGFMDLHIDTLDRDDAGNITLALAHYYRQNGDSVPDPDMEVKVYKHGMAEALAYQDSFGYRRVYPEPGKVAPRAKRELNSFLAYWLKNILDQGHKRQEAA